MRLFRRIEGALVERSANTLALRQDNQGGLDCRGAPDAASPTNAALVAAIAVLYSLWILTVSGAFYVVRVDNLTHLFSAIFDSNVTPRDALVAQDHAGRGIPPDFDGAFEPYAEPDVGPRHDRERGRHGLMELGLERFLELPGVRERRGPNGCAAAERWF